MESNLSPVAVLGAGAWGAALAIVLARNGTPVRLWDVDAKLISAMQEERMQPSRLPGIPFPKLLQPVVDLKDAVDGVRDICLVVPSFAFKTVLTQLKSLVLDDVRFVWGTKGLEPDSAGFMHNLIIDIYGSKTPIAILSGPSFAKEAAKGLPTAVSLAGNNSDFLEFLSTRFSGKNFSIEVLSDIVGVQLCGVVKNVMAIATGIVDGMGYGANTRCALITRALSEMSDICVALGGNKDTVLSLAGVGDLVLTCTDNQSRNRRLGLAIGAGDAAVSALKNIGESVEGYYNTKQLHQLAKENSVNAKIVNSVYQILYEGESAKILLSSL